MAHLILLSAQMTDTQISDLTQRGFAFVTPQTITPDQIPNVEISYGWDAHVGSLMLGHPESKLSWVQSSSAGVDYFPLEKFKARHITLTNASGLKAMPIAQSVLGYILHFAR